MFEDLKPQPQESPKSKVQSPKLEEKIAKAKELEDIFANDEDKNKPFLKEVNPEDKRKKEEAAEQEASNSNKKRIIFISISVSAIVLIVAFFVVWNKRGSQKEGIKNQELRITNQEEGISAQDGAVSGGKNQPAQKEEKREEKLEIRNLKLEIRDTDGDGLADEEEAKLGTSSNNVDTDGDGLSDREEINVYKTDPLNPDSDSDSYLDGAEVKSGYNPKGAGKLYGNSPNSPK